MIHLLFSFQLTSFLKCILKRKKGPHYYKWKNQYHWREEKKEAKCESDNCQGLSVGHWTPPHCPHSGAHWFPSVHLILMRVVMTAMPQTGKLLSQYTDN